MRLHLNHLSAACALGRTNAEVLANGLVGSVAGMVPLADDVPGRTLRFGLVPGELPPTGDPVYEMRTDRLLLHAVNAMRPVLDALLAKYGPSRVAIVLGASNTGIDEAQTFVDQWLAAGAKPAALDFSQIELGTPAAYLQKLLGTTGPAYTVSTACSSSAKAFGSARRLIAAGVADAAVVGGVDGRCRFAMNGFNALGALAAGATDPVSAARDGINLGEGIALFTMETEGSGVVLAGLGESSDAYHATAPDPEGRGAEAAMRAALADAALDPAAIDYVNLHGTGTRANDSMEAKAVARVLGLDVPCASTKPMTGHTLGAAGALEAALGWLMMSPANPANLLMPHLWDGVRDPELPPIRLAAKGESRPVRHFLSNSFAFGGSNATVILSRED